MAGQRARSARPFFVKTLAACGELSPAISARETVSCPIEMAGTSPAMTERLSRHSGELLTQI
jgi:hypothetical protein